MSALRDDQGGALRSYTYDTVGSMVTRSSGGGTRRSSSTTARTSSGRPPAPAPARAWRSFYDHAGQRAAVVTRDAGGAVELVRVFFGDAEVVLSPTGWVTRAPTRTCRWARRSRASPTAASWAQYHGLANSTLVSAAPTGDIQSSFISRPVRRGARVEWARRSRTSTAGSTTSSRTT
ncbi:MAG: hypothetical protein HS111_20905 [Kofleriaceae bacterium]|nr:hypothetical protein [Kofleriaceae bacterium]